MTGRSGWIGVLLGIAIEGAVLYSSGVGGSAAAEPVAPDAFHADSSFVEGGPAARPAGRVDRAEGAPPDDAAGEGALPAQARMSTGAHGAFPSSRAFLDTIRVVDARPGIDARLARLPYHATVARLAGATRRVVTVADVLEQAAGVRVRRYGGIGAFAAASIRGSSPSQVEVYLDGLPLNSAQWGAPDLAGIPLGPLERVEIYRAGAPATFGTPGLGGIVNLVTRDTSRRMARASASGGSFGTARGLWLSSGPVGAFDHLLTLQHARSRGDFPFRYDPGTPGTPGDDERRPRANNGFDETSLLAKLSWGAAGRPRVTLAEHWYTKDGGLSGRGNEIRREASFDVRRHRASLVAEAPALGDGGLPARLGSRAAVFLDRGRQGTYNPAHETGLDFSDVVNRTRAHGANARIASRWPEAATTVDLHGEWIEERFEPEDARTRAAGGTFERARRTRNAALEAECAPGGGRLVLLGTLRRREASDNYYGPLPFGRPPSERADRHVTRARGNSLGARCELMEGLHLRVNRIADVRFPTMYELFGNGGDARMSPTLGPERSVTWDAGISWRMGEDGGGGSGGGAGEGGPRLTVSLGAFHAGRDSMIVFVQNSARNFVAQNLERVVVKGLEVEAGARPVRRVTWAASVTLMDAHQETVAPQWDGREVPYVSPVEASLRTIVAATDAVELRHEYLHFGRYYQDRANLAEGRVDAHGLHAVGATWRVPGPRMSVNVDVENAFDREVEDVFGYAMPGRTVYLTVEASFGRGE